MKYKTSEIYHIFNQGNNRRDLFMEPRNYAFFLKKMQKYLKPTAHILAYCLMPNHFHWLIQVKEDGTLPSPAAVPRFNGKHDSIVWKSTHSQQRLSHDIGTLLSSYTKAINKIMGWSGSLFRSNTQCKSIDFETDEGEYLITCFEYIHNNPVKAKLASHSEYYPYCSAFEISEQIKEGLCDLDALRALGLMQTVPNEGA